MIWLPLMTLQIAKADHVRGIDAHICETLAPANMIAEAVAQPAFTRCVNAVACDTRVSLPKAISSNPEDDDLAFGGRGESWQ